MEEPKVIQFQDTKGFTIDCEKDPKLGFTYYALIDNDTERFQVLIAALNANIDYVKIHAMTKGEEGDEPEPTPDDQGGDGGEVTPVTPEA